MGKENPGGYEYVVDIRLRIGAWAMRHSAEQARSYAREVVGSALLAQDSPLQGFVIMGTQYTLDGKEVAE